MMKQHALPSFYATRSASVNNYDAQELARRLNDSVYKAAKDTQEEAMRKKIEEEVTAKLTT